MNNFSDYIADEIAIGKRIDAFPDRFSQLCVEKWELGIHDQLITNTILSRVRSRQNKIKRGDVVPFRRARFPQGDVFLGRDLAADWHLNGEIWLPKHFFGTPWLIAANTGSGKSVLAANLALGLDQANGGHKTWQFGLLKDDQMGQLRRFPVAGLELVTVEAKDLKVNPLDAGRNEPRTHLKSAMSRLSRWLSDLPLRASLILRAVCHEAYRVFGIFDGQRERFPTLFWVYNKILTSPGLNVAARDALLDRLGSFLEGFTPQCGAWLKGWDPVDLARHSMLFRFWRAGDDVKSFLIDWFVDHVFQHQVERGIVNGDLELCIFVDDAQRLINSNGNSAMTSLDQQVGRNRGGGINPLFFVQTQHGVSLHLLPNVNARLMGRTVEHEARVTMGRNLGLTDAQIEWARLNLKPGQFVCNIAEGDWHEPFVFETRNINLAHDVTEAEIIESQRPLEALPVIPDVDFQKWERRPVLELQSDSDSPRLSPAEARIFDAVCQEPGKPAGLYSRKLGLNGTVARAARERLVQLGLIREHRVQLNQHGKPSIVLEPLPAAHAPANPSPEEP